MDVMKDFGGSRYKGGKEVGQMSSVSWRPEIPSLILGLALGVCVGFAASNLTIAKVGGRSFAETQPMEEVIHHESVKFEFYDVLKNR
jgi:hypothetical protein